MTSITLNPIGVVRSPLKQGPVKDRRTVVSEIILDKGFAGGARGLEEFSHIYVLYWAHRARARRKTSLMVNPAGRTDVAPVGVFASRSPHRPNRILQSIVEVLERKGNVLRVRGLDALDGSPVLDIKPYDLFDVIDNPRMAAWWLQIHDQCSVKRK
ncbi:MAG: tRNA (N6-threonylcarbamoyladenosine(37)-N6)-methyltransferase TrmO [Thaumarchaeota archaeon]|nr:tRNA (N6-threonylcarbamoyladenosine(37)-N6)-methyltransferase TrmO [Nitrososphaerota archaeon]